MWRRPVRSLVVGWLSTSSQRMLLLPFFLHLLYPGLAFGDALPSTNIPSKAHCEIKRGGIAWPWLAYKSSDQKPPHMKMSGNGKDLAEGYIFISPIAPTIDPELSFAKETGVFIMTTDGDLIYGEFLPESLLVNPSQNIKLPALLTLIGPV